MKKLLVPFCFFIVLASSALAFLQVSESAFLNNFSILILGIESLLVIIISANLVKFLNITRKNKIVRLIYVTIGLFLFNSILNLLYFISQGMGWKSDYTYVYLIERIIITIAFLIISVGFFKFNKLLRAKI
ncbi:hypothetical protein JXB41_04345 [Candidatus Woesearchaeota archaeon]|nr:hypothetical protein [Candidatus Woesearchaeota archaeon]